MSIVDSSKAFLLYIYRVKLLRFLIFFVVILFLLYAALASTLVPFFLTKTIKDNYSQATGHQLQFDGLVFSPFKLTLAIHQLKDSANLWQVEYISVDVALMQSIRQSILVVNEITIRQLVANPHQLESGLWNFDDVLKHVGAAKTNEKKSSTNHAPLLIKKVTLNNATVNSNALALNNLALLVAPLNVTLSNIDLRGKSLASISLTASINQATPLKIKGVINPQALNAELDLDISALPFIWFNAVIKPYVALDVLDGAVDTRSHISINSGIPTHVVSSGALTNFKLRPVNIEQDVIKWKSLVWKDVAVAMTEKFATIPLISLDEFDGQFIIHKDRTSNVQAMLVRDGEPKPSQSSSSFVVGNLPEPVSAPWKFTINRVAINNAAVGFYDQSLTPSFMAIVQQFSGDIKNIASDEQQTAKINLTGNVDGTAPVHLSGEAKPFMLMPQVDVLFSFEKIDMGALSPYSAEYAGWRIKKGLLSVDLHYRYENGLIVGKNHAVIDHLVFGEKVRSPRAIDIPLRLGLALLTDENGIAVLDAEISGDPKNPAFNVGALVIRALRNTFKKMITVPFRFLSGLIHSDEDLGRIDFTYGESQLSEQAVNKLKLLQQALKKRPAMRLSIQGIYDGERDLQALKEEQVKSELRKLGVSDDDNRSHNVVWQQAVVHFYQSQGPTNAGVSVDEKFQALTALQIVSPDRLTKLAHERALAVKQYLILQLGVASDTLFLNSDVTCVAVKQCLGGAVIFTLES